MFDVVVRHGQLQAMSQRTFLKLSFQGDVQGSFAFVFKHIGVDLPVGFDEAGLAVHENLTDIRI